MLKSAFDDKFALLPSAFFGLSGTLPISAEIEIQCHWGCSMPGEGWLKGMDVVVS